MNATLHNLALMTHLVGAVLWIGGSVVAGLAATDIARSLSHGRSTALSAIRRTMLRVVTPGLLLAWVGGLTMFIGEIGVYRSAGWLHTKITVALVLAALTGVLTARLRRAARVDTTVAVPELGTIRTLTLLIVLGVLAVLYLAVWRAVVP